MSFSHLGDLGEQWQYAVDLGYSRTDGDFDLEFDTWSGAFSMYPNRDVEFGVRVVHQPAYFFAFDTTSYGGFVSWFVTPGVELAASYRIDDVDSLGGLSGPSAQTSGDADQDSIGVSVTVRF